MKNFFFALLGFLFLAEVLFTQESFDVVPKQYSFELAYRTNFSNDFVQSNNNGYSVLLDYAWQLSGFQKKSISYISVPLGYTYFPASESDTSYSLLSYGWSVRHMLGRDKKIIPFIGYGLLLNQMRFNNIEGSIIGHKTALNFGFLLNSPSNIKPYIKFEYSYSRFGLLKENKGKKIKAFEIVLGIRIK